MRNTYFLLLVLFLLNGISNAQRTMDPVLVVSDLENLALEPDTYWNGSDLSGSFTSGLAVFPNDFNPDWIAWNKWAYSNMADDTTAGFMNQYSAVTGEGYDPGASGGSTYAVSYVLSDFITTALIPVPVSFADGLPHHPVGLYVTNGTYPALAMENGDEYSKKFGGETGDDPDYFKLMIWGVYNGTATDTVEFYLADYRFPDNDEDYIVKSWEWVDLGPLGIVDSIMFSLESTDNGMYGMNTPAFFCIDNLSIEYENTAVSDHITEVIEYVPAPGQHINAAPWGWPSSVTTIIGGVDGSLSLGAFGGYTVFIFDHAIENHPDNPYGVDFSIFGNPMTDASEPGMVYVMKDENWNGLADDTWYLLAGSDHWFSGSLDHYEVTYYKPGPASDVPWTDNRGNSGYIYANAVHEQPYYPLPDSFPGIPEDQYMLEGYMITGMIDTSSIALVKSRQRSFGYADNRLRGTAPYFIPDNPYTLEKENAGGDAFDISWAIDSNGNYIDLDMIHFIKVQTGVMGNAGWLGEISTEITGAADVHPDPGYTGILDMIVIKDLPVVIDTPHYQLEVFAFHQGRIVPGAEMELETSVSWASIDENNLLTLSNSGALEITARLVSDPSVMASAFCEVELPASVAEVTDLRIIIFPNPADEYIVVKGTTKARLEIYNLRGGLVAASENITDGQPISTRDLPGGLYLLRITTAASSLVMKFIRR